MRLTRTPSGLWIPNMVWLGAGDLRQVGSADGKVRVKSNGPVVAGSGDPCCCAPPPANCSNLPSAASAIVTGATGGGSVANGTYSFNANYSQSACCVIFLTAIAGYELWLVYWKSDGHFWSALSTGGATWGGSETDRSCSYGTSYEWQVPDGTITLVGGRWVGSYIMPNLTGGSAAVSVTFS
jgi:hypothetical protein